jgi:hypothetical protein
VSVQRSRNAGGAILAALALACLPAGAADRIGRTALDVPEGFVQVHAWEGRLTFNGGEHSIPLHHVLYQLPGPDDTPRALLQVTSTEGGNRANVDWISETCPEPRPKYFTEDYGTRALKARRECMVVNSEFVPARFFKPDAEVPKVLEDKGLKFFRSGHSLRTVLGARAGTLVRVNLMVQRGFEGLPGAAVRAGDLHETPPALVAWGEALHDAVNTSVFSVGGALRLPPIAFGK